NAEGKLDAAGIDDVLEVSEDSLGRFRAEVGDTRLVFQSADERLEHEVERSGLGQRTPFVGRWADDLVAVGEVKLHVGDDRGRRRRLAELLGKLGGLLL